MQIFPRAPITPRAAVSTDHGPLVRNPLNNNSRADIGWRQLPLSSANAITNDSIRDRTKLRKQQAQTTYLTHMTTTESKSRPVATKAALSDLSEKGVKE